MTDEDGKTLLAVTRRQILGTGAAIRGTLLMAGVPRTAHAAGLAPANAQAAGAPEPGAPVDVTLHINGHLRQLQLDPRTTLLDALREHVAMTGTKKGCDHGQCGACTVLLEGRRINSCLTLAVMHDGQAITTIEGLANGETLHPMQAAFVDGFQCRYCTVGQICSAVGMLAESRGGMPSYVTGDLSVVGYIPYALCIAAWKPTAAGLGFRTEAHLRKLPVSTQPAAAYPRVD